MTYQRATPKFHRSDLTPMRAGGERRQKTGIANAKEKDDAYRGRKPSYSREQFQTVVDLIGKSMNVLEIAQASSLSRHTVYRIKEDPAAAEKAFTVRGM